MLSRIALSSGSFGSLLAKQNSVALAVVRCAGNTVTKPPAEIHYDTNKTKLSIKEHIANWDEANKVFYGPERDLEKFPHPVLPEKEPPTRMAVFPESWFTRLYDKTGVTGPYMLGFGAVTFLLSKEYWILEHNFMDFVAFWIMTGIGLKTLGPKMRASMEKYQQELLDKRWVEPLAKMKADAKIGIENGERFIWQQEGQKYLYEAKRENVDIQLEAAYRENLHNVYLEVKKRLDYQVELENTKRVVEQNHMVDWIVSSVVKGITPQQEKESITKCIQDLKSMSVAS